MVFPVIYVHGVSLSCKILHAYEMTGKCFPEGNEKGSKSGHIVFLATGKGEGINQEPRCCNCTSIALGHHDEHHNSTMNSSNEERMF